jgi:hypothetical protein
MFSIFFVQILAVDHASAEGAIVPNGSPRTKVVAMCHLKHLSPTVFPKVDLVMFPTLSHSISRHVVSKY